MVCLNGLRKGRALERGLLKEWLLPKGLLPKWPLCLEREQ